MPSCMIHLYTAYQFQKSCHLIKNPSQFYLGCLSPDAVDVHGFARKEERWHAHLRDQSIEQWMQNAIDFYTDQTDKGNYDYLVGYLLHLFTDIAWDKKFDEKLWKVMEQLDIPQEKKLEMRWDELFAFDKTQFEKAWWKDEVFPALQKGIPVSINQISSEKISEFQAFTLTQYQASIQHKQGTFITQQMIDEFALYAIALLKNQW